MVDYDHYGVFQGGNMDSGDEMRKVAAFGGSGMEGQRLYVLLAFLRLREQDFHENSGRWEQTPYIPEWCNFWMDVVPTVYELVHCVWFGPSTRKARRAHNRKSQEMSIVFMFNHQDKTTKKSCFLAVKQNKQN